MGEVRFALAYTKLVDRNLQPPGLGVIRVKIYDYDYDIGEICRSFIVTEQMVISYLAEANIARHMQTRIFLTYSIEPRQNVFEMTIFVPIPLPDLILFRVKILFLIRERFCYT